MDQIKGGFVEIESETLNPTRFFDIIKELSLAKSSDDLLDRLLKKVSGLFDPEVASFLLKDPVSGDLRYALVQGEETDNLKDRLVRRGEGVCGLTAETNQNLIITDCAKDPRFNPDVDRIPGIEIKSLMAVPFRIERIAYGLVYLINKRNKLAFSLEEFKLMMALVAFAELTLERMILLKQIRELEDFDQLTQAYNPKTFFEYFEREVARSERYGSDLSMLKVDIDYFEKIIQTFGQDAGERVLLNLSFILKKMTRKVDLVARVGEYEFLVLLPNTPRAGAQRVRERLQKILENQNLRATGIPYTVSVEVYSGSGESAINLYKIPKINTLLNQISRKSRRRKYPTVGEELEEAVAGSLFSGQK
jgi:diguanylate cyclase (GGDEF)-like protein